MLSRSGSNQCEIPDRVLGDETQVKRVPFYVRLKVDERLVKPKKLMSAGEYTNLLLLLRLSHTLPSQIQENGQKALLALQN